MLKKTKSLLIRVKPKSGILKDVTSHYELGNKVFTQNALHLEHMCI